MTTKVRIPLSSSTARHIRMADIDLPTEICEDVQEECSKYGKVLEMKVPRPSGGSRQSAGVGKIFVKFDNADSASKALKSLAGRKFADRTVVVTYFSEVCHSSPTIRFHEQHTY
jgi:splicing factor U2AF 65 kDa subunit